MKRAATNAIAGLLGMSLGWVVTATPLASVLTPTWVTWEAASCPPGVYTITSVARSLGSHQTYRTSSADVTLPRAWVVQEFPDLPAGSYTVTATARRTDGQTFGSGAQTLVGFGGASGLSARGRPATVASSSRAARRRAGRGDGAQQTPASAQSALSVVPARSTATAKRREPAPKLVEPSAEAPMRFRIPINAIGDVLETNLDWRRIEIADHDADAAFDVITIELANGEIWIIHVLR